MPLKDLLEKEWGIRTDIQINPLTSQVTTAIRPILLNNPNRLAWTLINLGACPIFLAFDARPSPTRGILVAQVGGVCGLLWHEDFELVTFPVWAVAESNTCDIYLVEVSEI